MSTPKPSDWFGQPRGLTVLFLTEMWEKFSFYGMRALLVYYMTKQLGFPLAKASLIYGVYTGFVYFTPVFGGMLADRWLGRRRAVILGGSIMAVGHVLMAFPPLLYPALATIAIGNGLFLPNLPSQIDRLYGHDDPRRGSAFNVYYVGVNLGAFLAPLVCGTLGELYGWHLGFGAAAVGMTAGLVVYGYGTRWLGPDDRPGAASEVARDGGLRSRLPLLGAIVAAVIVFRGAYEQIGNTIALWADADVDRHVGAFLVPGSWFQSLNPLLVFLLTPPLVAAWTRAARRGREWSAVRKMMVGALGLAGSYLLLAAVARASAQSGVAAPAAMLIAFLFVYTLAELFILPVGLGLFSRLAGERHRATVIAIWFFASCLGNLLAGYLGTFWQPLGAQAFFTVMAAVAGLAALALWRLERPAGAAEAAA